MSRSSRLIRQWMRGEAKSADEALLNYVLTLWRTIKATGKDDTIARVSLTPTIRAELTRLKNTTGKGAMSLLAGRKDKPKGLKSNIVTGWLNGHGDHSEEISPYLYDELVESR